MLSCATTTDQSGDERDSYEEVLCIPHKGPGTSPSDCLVSYLEPSFAEGLTRQRNILQSQSTGQIKQGDCRKSLQEILKSPVSSYWS